MGRRRVREAVCGPGDGSSVWVDGESVRRCVDPVMAALYGQICMGRRRVRDTVWGPGNGSSVWVAIAGAMQQLCGEQTTLFSSTRRGILWKWLSPTGGGATTQFGPDCVLDYLRCSFAFCVGFNQSFLPSRG